MTELVLIINAGSTGLKFAAYSLSGTSSRITGGAATCSDGMFKIKFQNGDEAVAQDSGDLDAQIVDHLEAEFSDFSIVAVGHRVVHGGADHKGPAVLTGSLLGTLASLEPFAPLHQSAAINGVVRLQKLIPGAINIACFDTAFHSNLPLTERELPLPAPLREHGYRRYGFHGLSYKYIAGWLREHRPAHERVVAAHLGGGSSLCALKGGVSVATTMGMTALDGLPMTTRVGAIDPGIVLHLAREAGIEPVEKLLYERSGLAGLSDTDGDMRRMRDADTAEAALAVAIFTSRIAQAAAALTVPLGGIDALIFTGGIGANDRRLRVDVSAALAHLGLFETLSTDTDEELVMAREVIGLLNQHDPSLFKRMNSNAL
ncbi:acetate/propionate family kinase [Novosphingopyxis sp.]|uniref:acetate/propionate family kinase n=1 Tax=Novosphingopyxis sp. TaxID=2709690 RepID=UPI003B5B3BA8